MVFDSTSCVVMVVTAVVFSAILIDAGPPPPFELIDGASFTAVTVKLTVAVELFTSPSDIL